MTRADDAIVRAVRYLAQVQCPSGELPVDTCHDPAMRGACTPDPSIFPTALAVSCLCAVPAAANVVDRARAFLRAEMDIHGLWRHWPKTHPHHRRLPPDMDDSACAAAALQQVEPDNRRLLLANRRADGLFFTWIVPRPRWTGRAHVLATLAQLRHLPTLALFFRRTSARPGDVDAVVNANALHRLGAFEGRQRVEDHLLAVLRDGAERVCDKWYDDPIVVLYFLARAIGHRDDAAGLIADRLADLPRSTALHAALAISASLRCGRPPLPSDTDALVTGQLPSGAWPRAALYHGGRKRSRHGFDPPHPDTPYWGSEALTTAFAIEALFGTTPDQPCPAT